MTTYNPFPNLPVQAPVWTNSGNCYATATYADKADAEAVAKFVRERGDTANGGYLDGMALGNVTPVPAGWQVDYA
ncbi:MAG TPA: hypothetical protein VIT65_10735 [Microlunatus sp.]